MNENLDLSKILNNAAEGTMLYSTVYGEIWLDGVYFDEIRCTDIEDSYFYFTNEGKIQDRHGCAYYDSECVLFPSKDQRDWSKFKIDENAND